MLVDLRHLLRNLRRSPASAIAAVLTLSLTLGPKRILNAVLGQGALMVGAGLVVGGVLSIWVTRALTTVIFATDRLDALSIGVAALVLVIAGACAVLPAALCAARTDPLAALRAE